MGNTLAWFVIVTTAAASYVHLCRRAPPRHDTTLVAEIWNQLRLRVLSILSIRVSTFPLCCYCVSFLSLSLS